MKYDDVYVLWLIIVCEWVGDVLFVDVLLVMGFVLDVFGVAVSSCVGVCISSRVCIVVVLSVCISDEPSVCYYI